MEKVSETNEFAMMSAAEVLSLFDKEFTDEEIEKFFQGIPSQESKDFFNSFPPDGKECILVLHNLGPQKREQLHEYVRAHATIQGGVHNLANWFGIYEDIMRP